MPSNFTDGWEKGYAAALADVLFALGLDGERGARLWIAKHAPAEPTTTTTDTTDTATTSTREDQP